jgi:hypothetical protein
LDPLSLKLHKEDHATTHKRCPGANLRKVLLVTELSARLAARRAPLGSADLVAAVHLPGDSSGTEV